MDIAAEVARRTSSVGVALTHWSGVMEPVAAAEQIAALDRLSGGRLSLRFLIGPDGRDGELADHSHVEALRQTDEYVVLLKRLWSNEHPFDHEGPHYSLRGGFAAEKGPQGADIVIRMGGVSGIALDVAGRHATLFELAADTEQEIRDLIARVEAAAGRYGRAGRIRYALPVHFTRHGPHHAVPSFPVGVSGSATGIAHALLRYATLGVEEFMLSGLDDHDSVAAFARDIAPLFQRTVPIQAARRAAGFTRPGGRTQWAS
jgi:alkanesulfonate monooxygenase